MLPPSFFAKSGFTLRARPVVRWARPSGVARSPHKLATSTPGDASHFASGGVLRALPGARASCAPGLGAATADGALPPGPQSIVELDEVRDQRGEASRELASDVFGEAPAAGAEPGADAGLDVATDEMLASLPRRFICF